MHTLKDWKAKRSGARMTISGTNAGDGQPAKVMVDEIRSEAGQVIGSLDGVAMVQLLF